MKIRFGKDATGPYVEVTHTVRDQDDLVGSDFYALDPEDRTKVCEHLPRAVNDRPAVRDHSEATATPPPGTVAALLLKVEEAERDATDCGAAPGSTEEARSVYMGQASGLREAARLITATLGAPTPLAGALDDDPAVVPMLRQRIRDLEAQVGKIGDALVSARAREASPLDRAVAEVCAVDVSGIVDAEPGTYFMTIADLANGEGQMSDRDRNMMIAAIAIRSVLACDASATKEPG